MKIRILTACGPKMDASGISLEAETDAEKDQLQRIEAEILKTKGDWWTWRSWDYNGGGIAMAFRERKINA